MWQLWQMTISFIGASAAFSAGKRCWLSAEMSQLQIIDECLYVCECVCVSLYWLCLLSSSGTQKKRFDRKWAHSGKCWWTRRALSPERDHTLSQCKLPSIRFYIYDGCIKLSSQNAMLALIFLPTKKKAWKQSSNRGSVCEVNCSKSQSRSSPTTSPAKYPDESQTGSGEGGASCR